MDYYILFLLLLCFFGAVFFYNRRFKNLRGETYITGENLFLKFMLIALFAFFVMQGETANGDLIQYKTSYERNAGLGISDFIKSFADIKDPVYYMTGNLFAKLGVSFYCWKLIINFLFVLSSYRLIKKYSSNIFLSFMYLIILGSFSFAMSGLRQTLALSILTFSFGFLQDKKFWKFLILVIAASLFHSTAIVFVIAYPIYNMKERKKNLLIVSLVAVFIALNSSSIMKFYIDMIGQEEIYGGYLDRDTTLTMAGFIIFFFVTVFCVIFLWNDKSAKYRRLCFLSIISLVFRFLSATALAELFRISLYFSVFEPIMLAEASACTDNAENENASIKTFAVSAILLVYYIYTHLGIII